MPPRILVLLGALAALAALPALAQPGAVRFQQPLGGGYEVQIRTASEAQCPGEPERLFGAAEGTSLFELYRSGPATCDADETLSLWRDGTPLDSVGGHRLWLGAALDTLMWEDLPPEAHPVPEGAVRDLTGDGVPEVVVSSWSGGAHCCFSYLVVELGETPRLLAAVDAADSEVEVRDADGDGVPELWLHDFAFAYWNTSFAGSPAPRVALAWDGEAFSPSERHMRLPPLAPDTLAALAETVRADPAWARQTFPPEAYWGTLLDLLYAGRGAEATTFAEAAWPGDALGRTVFLAWFRDQLWRSPYASAVVEMNAGWR